MDNLISVIVPIYNVEKYLNKCIDGIIDQTYKKLEIILVDDGSTDDCPKIIDEYAKKDSRIKVIHKENGGLSSARNEGLKIATGEYITFADSDDIPNIRQYEVLLGLIKKYDVGISFCEHQKIYENEEVKEERSIKEIERVFSTEEAIKEIILNERVGNYVWSKMFKRELFDGIEFPIGKTYEDVAILYKIIDKVDKIAYTNEKLYYYLVGREGAITAKFSEKKIRDIIEAQHAQYKFWSSKYKSIKDYLDVCYIKSYTSIIEKMCINEYNDMFFSKEIIKIHEDFKSAFDSLNDDILYKFLEPYRVISAALLRYNREIYMKMSKFLYENVKIINK